ncbi:hypothetical protein LAZ67_18000536 [Cordylochernes scorpioides]|uniref:Uncharacterized protein n=1 Tax=Cordylochernes scorpioides TaxID=51811 RepID=A0ABY6LJT0_9ARAC|nr:hypothetical protein LAZ67_18000536 [Cordylochernes scorpioides]
MLQVLFNDLISILYMKLKRKCAVVNEAFKSIRELRIVKPPKILSYSLKVAGGCKRVAQDVGSLTPGRATLGVKAVLHTRLIHVLLNSDPEIWLLNPSSEYPHCQENR